jgi:hypothetical protein
VSGRAEVGEVEEAALRRWLLGASPEEPQGMFDARSRAIYRRQVRRSLFSGVRVALPIARRLLGEDGLDAQIGRWLEASAPTTRLFWQLPAEFAAWYAEHPDPAYPAALAELIHWEAVEVEVIHAPAAEAAPLSGLSLELSSELGVMLDPSARLCIFRHAVHRMTQEAAAWPPPLEAPLFLVTWRREERQVWREVGAPVAQAVALLAEGQTWGEASSFVVGLYGGQVEAGSLLEGVEALRERGAVLGYVSPEGTGQR